MANPPASLLLLQRQLRALQSLLAQHHERRCLKNAIESRALSSAAVPNANANANANDERPPVRPRSTSTRNRTRKPPSPLLPDPSSSPSSSSSAAAAAEASRASGIAKATKTPPPPPSLARLAASDLFALIRAARSLGELELLLARHAASFQAPHVAAALIALPPLVNYGGSTTAGEPNRRARSHRLVRLLAAQGLARGGAAARLSGSDAAECLRAMARVRCAPKEAVDALAARLSERNGAAVALLQPREMAAAAWALAAIERRQGEGWWAEEEEEAQEEVTHRQENGANERLEAGEGGTHASTLPPYSPPALPALLVPPPSADNADDNNQDDEDEANALLTSALIATLPVPEPPPVPPRGRGAAPLPPALPPLPRSPAPAAAAGSTTTALVRGSKQPPSVAALWAHLEARSRALVHNFAPNHAAALAWAFAVTGRCSNHRGSGGGREAARADEEEEKEDEDEAASAESGTDSPAARPRRRREPVNLLTALSRSLLMRQHTLTDPAVVARLLEALSLAASAGGGGGSLSSPPSPAGRHSTPHLPRAQRELAVALGDRVAQLKAAFYPPVQLVGCLSALERAGVYHPLAAGAVGAMVSSRLRPASSSSSSSPASPSPLSPSLAQSSLTCLRGGWVPAAIPAYLSAAWRLSHADPPALLACARSLPAAAPHLSAEALVGVLEALVDLGLGSGRGVEVVAGAGGGGGGEGEGERQALALAAAAVRAEVDRAGPGELSPGAAARLLWSYAMVWGDELLEPEGAGRQDGDRSPPPSPLDAPLQALGAASASSSSLSPLELHRLYQAHRLLTESWALEDDQVKEEEEANEDGRWPARLVRAAAAAARRRFAGGRAAAPFSSPLPRLQHLCDLLSEAGLDPILGAGGGADGGGIPVDVAVVLEEEETGSRPPRLVALLLDEDEGGAGASSPSLSPWRRRAANPPHGLLGAAEADARILTERLGWSAVVRVPWFEWEAVLAAERASALSHGRGAVRLRGGGSAAAALRRAREGEEAMMTDLEDVGEPDDGALLAWVHNKLLSAV